MPQTDEPIASASESALLKQARQALRDQNWREAQDLWNLVLEKAPDHPEGLAGRGLALLKEGQFAEAVASLTHAVTVNPGDQKSLKRLSNIAMAHSGPATLEQEPKTKPGRYHRDTIGEVMALSREFGFKPETVIDVGVNTGTPGLYSDFPDAKYILVDPIAENEVFMTHMCSTLKDGHYELVAAGAKKGTLTLSVHPGIGGSRLSDTVGAHPAGEDRKVPVETLDALCRKHGAAGPYVIKVDVEGAELFVLEGARKILVETELLILETRLVQIGKAPDLTKTLQFLDKNGFAAYDIIDRNYHKVDRSLKQFDLVAVRKDGYFRSGNVNKKFIPTPSGDFAGKVIAGKLSKRKNMLEQITPSSAEEGKT